MVIIIININYIAIINFMYNRLLISLYGTRKKKKVFNYHIIINNLIFTNLGIYLFIIYLFYFSYFIIIDLIFKSW